jgi:hypothetical protein
MPKVNSYTFDQNVLKNSNITSSINVSHPIKNKGTSIALEA